MTQIELYLRQCSLNQLFWIISQTYKAEEITFRDWIINNTKLVLNFKTEWEKFGRADEKKLRTNTAKPVVFFPFAYVVMEFRIKWNAHDVFIDKQISCHKRKQSEINSIF